jgi:hypothetical protein
MHGPSVAKVIPYSDALPMDANAKLSKEGIKELRFVMYTAFQQRMLMRHKLAPFPNTGQTLMTSLERTPSVHSV